MQVMGIDIGGSGVKGAPVDCESGELLQERCRIPTPQPATPDAVARTVREVVRHFNWHGEIGCGFPARVQHGVVKTAANIAAEWIGVNGETLFTQATGCAARLINDADAAGLAEMQFGAGRRETGLVMLITVGTGLGTALFCGGHLVPNTEFGHVYLKKMIAEHYASDAARKQEQLEWPQWAKRFDKYLLHLERLLSPDLFIIGGGVSRKFDKFAPYLSLNARVVPAQLLNQAGIIGAALAAGLHRS